MVLLIAVLPAEKGIDPTGLGRIIGLQEMGEVKKGLAQEMADEAAFSEASASADSLAIATFGAQAAKPASVTNFTLAPQQEMEVKLRLSKGARVIYAWWTSGGSVDYEARWSMPNGSAGNPAREDGRRISAKAGVLYAEADRQYAWSWHNQTKAPVIITLRTNGDSVRLIQ
ncbi:MAG: transmembrane anchor protein [Gemmatimonadota bacterium]